MLLKPPIRKELINLSYQFLSENSRLFSEENK
nr:MAG TPA: hypothetical protein [Bacteriophage sp.]